MQSRRKKVIEDAKITNFQKGKLSELYSHEKLSTLAVRLMEDFNPASPVEFGNDKEVYCVEIYTHEYRLYRGDIKKIC